MISKKAIILSFLLVFCVSATAFAADSTYTDVKTTNWAYPAVKAMSDKEILKGYPDGSFKPLKTLTYGEFLKMIVLSTGEVDPGNAFDADGNALIDEATGQKMNWAQKYYDATLNKGYFTTYQIHSSKLNNDIPRGDMAILVSAVLGDIMPENYDELKEGIKDISAQSKNEYDIIKSYGAGILTGYEDGSFKPEGTLNRAEAATVIYRLVDEIKRLAPESGTKGIPSVSPGAVTAEGIPLTGKVSDIIKNYDTFTLPNGMIDEFTVNAKTYEIVADPTPYRFELKENRGTKWMQGINLNQVYLVDKGNIVEFLGSGGGFATIDGYADPVQMTKTFYKTDNLFKAEYIMTLKTSTGEVTLIPNPFKK